MSAVTSRLRLPGRIPRVKGMAGPSGISAIIVKELRGRMRGRRAFIVLTIHVLLLSVFAWMFQRLNEESISSLGSYGGQTTYASASVGRGIFMGLIFVQTLIVAVLAPAATAGAISSEREHQTLELLAVTPISSFAIVVGKLLSALAWVFILILASIPITALVFVFGGVSPDDVVRGYAVLFATVIGLGSIGIFFSALTRRTGASTGLTFVATLALAIGTMFVYVFLSSTAEVSSTGLRKQPPEAILYLNPFVAQADVICGTEEGGFGGACGFMSGILAPLDSDIVPPDVVPTKPVPGFGAPAGGATDDGVNLPVRRGDVIIDGDVQVAPAADSFRDRFWPKSVISFLILSLVLTAAAVKFVTPTRRWRPSLPGPVRRLTQRRSAP